MLNLNIKFMSNSKKTAEITDAILDQVKAVLEDKAQNKYSTSKIYAAHNAVFNKNETPESCASCLRKRADALVKWYGEYATSTNGKDKKAIDELPKQLGDAAHQGAPATDDELIAGVDEAQDFDLMDVTNKKGEALKIKFVTIEGDAGTATLEDGKALAAGTYTTKDGDTVAVQPGGKATLKSNLL